MVKLSCFFRRMSLKSPDRSTCSQASWIIHPPSSISLTSYHGYGNGSCPRALVATSQTNLGILAGLGKHDLPSSGVVQLDHRWTEVQIDRNPTHNSHNHQFWGMADDIMMNCCNSDPGLTPNHEQIPVWSLCCWASRTIRHLVETLLAHPANGWYPWFREQCDSWKFYQNVYVYVYVYINIYVYIYIHIYI